MMYMTTYGSKLFSISLSLVDHISTTASDPCLVVKFKNSQERKTETGGFDRSTQLVFRRYSC
ncbi:unnamed protein product [Prunus armeniaca]